MADYPTIGNDTLLGTAGADNIDGLAGNDTITGLSGNDTLIGGTGDDIFVIGGTDFGYDIYNGGDGADIIRLNADITVSSLRLTSANLIGTETLSMYGYDISGTGGNDAFDISGVTNVTSYNWIRMGDGADRFVGHVGADAVDGGSGNDTLNGGAGNDSLIGGSGNDYMLGGTGDDIFYISGTDFGTDTYLGGEGADIIRLSADVTVSSLRLTANAVNGTETLSMYGYDIAGTAGNDAFDISGITNVTSYNWILMGDGLDRFVGHVGADAVNGGSGNDTLNGGAGADSIIGGAGNDYLVGGTGDDVFYIEGTDFGRDTYNGGDGADMIRLTGDVTVSTLLLTASNVIGTETLSMYGYDIIGTTGNDNFDLSGITNVTSYSWIQMGDGLDRFVGHAGGDAVNGGAGGDTLNGRGGDDSLAGGAGNDLLFGETGNDNLDGGDGIDTVSYASATGGLRINLLQTAGQAVGGGHGTDALSGIENVIGSRFGDAIIGNNAGNRLVGDAGNDNLRGMAGNDQLFGGTGNDILQGASGNDTLNGQAGIDTASYAGASSGVTVDLRLSAAQSVGGGHGLDVLLGIENLLGSSFGDRLIGTGLNNVLNGDAGNDRLVGLAGNDNLLGGAGNDQLSGGDGNDILTGGVGADIMTGGAGTDAFIFAVGHGADQISDWQNGVDRIQIASGTWQGVTYDGFDDLRISQSASGALISFGGTSISLSGVSSGLLDASDFVFV